MFQRFIAVGRIGKEPEIRSTQAGARVASFSLATSEYVKGEEKTEWFNVVCWNEHLIEVIEKRAGKGSLVLIEGVVRTRSWEKNGEKRYTTEVVLDRFNSRLQVIEGRDRGDSDRAETPKAKQADPFDLGDEVPF